MRQRRSATVTFASDDFASFAPSSHPSTGLVLLLMSRCRWSQNKLRTRKQQQQNTTLKDRHGGEQAFCIFIEEKDGKSERYAMIFIADSTPPSTLCPCSNGSAVLKSGPEFLVFKIRLCKLDCVSHLTPAPLRSDRLSGVRCSSMVVVFNSKVSILGNTMA